MSDASHHDAGGAVRRVVVGVSTPTRPSRIATGGSARGG